MDTLDKHELSRLIIESLEGVITSERLNRLDQLLSQYPEAVEYYIRYLRIFSIMAGRETILFECDDIREVDVPGLEIWKELAEYEKTAPEIKPPEDEPSQELIQKVVYPPLEKPKFTKFQIFTLVMSAAAILFFVLFLRLAPEKPYAVEVATLVDQMNVTWADSAVKFKNGERFWTDRAPVVLDEGIVKIHYDDGVNVVVEGPAKFTIERSGIYVDYGRLFSQVSKAGLGFMVETPTTRLVDQGTEFGVQADVNGSTELHVIKGKVQLFAGTNGLAKTSQIVTENEAVRYNANTGKTEAVPMTANAFVRAINSKTRQVWHGETSLSLVSIVSGRDGFREVNSLIGLNPVNGEYTTSVIQKNRKTTNTYNSVASSDYIDGVFVPDGESGPVPITSLGHTFKCSNTSGVFTHEITAYKGAIKNQDTTVLPLIVQGEEVENESVLLLHSNVGITFDLQAICQSLPQLGLKRFKALGALTEGYVNETKTVEDLPDVDFWVLVDGQVRYEKLALKVEDGYVSLDIAFEPQDRFLTLIVTDGLRPEDGKREYPYGNDFFYLIDPQLCMAGRIEK